MLSLEIVASECHLPIRHRECCVSKDALQDEYVAPCSQKGDRRRV
jgi:hypothetical protein